MAAISITAGDVIPSSSAQLERRTADVSITAGQVLYKLANGKVGLYDANAASPVNVFEGIAVDTASAGQPVVYAKKDLGGLDIGATLAVGDTLWGSATPGGITITYADIVSGWYVLSLGVAYSTTNFYLNPTSAGVIKA